jgi:hypothetical protein
MTRRIFLTLLLFSMFLTGAAPLPIRLVCFTVVNKSGMDIELSLTSKDKEQFYYLSLTSKDKEQFYYLRIPEGTAGNPTEKVFTLIPDSYTSSIYYVELWDPVYGSQCGTKSQTLEIERNVRLTVKPCNLNPTSVGEPPAIVKFGGQNRRSSR